MSSTGAGSTPTKAELRGSLLAARAARPAADLAAARAALAALALARAGSLACVAAYEPLRTEPGSVELLDGLARAGVRVLTPVLLSDRDLAWESWPSSPSSEPAEPAGIGAAELLFVPALAVDRSGNRLGRGGGSYDRVLRWIEPRRALAVVYDEELLASVPVERHDVAVGSALTPSGLRPLGSAS
jgi:5-formyltetrahydrofolate cyclo-ligase